MLKRVFDFVKFYLHLHEDAKISLLKLPLLSLHTKTRGQKTTTFSFFERTRPSKSILEIVLLFFAPWTKIKPAKGAYFPHLFLRRSICLDELAGSEKIAVDPIINLHTTSRQQVAFVYTVCHKFGTSC
jgi:hypothetical protein